MNNPFDQAYLKKKNNPFDQAYLQRKSIELPRVGPTTQVLPVAEIPQPELSLEDQRDDFFLSNYTGPKDVPYDPQFEQQFQQWLYQRDLDLIVKHKGARMVHLDSFLQGVAGQSSSKDAEIAPITNFTGRIAGAIPRMQVMAGALNAPPGLLGAVVERAAVFGGEAVIEEAGKKVLGKPFDWGHVVEGTTYGGIIGSLQPIPWNPAKIILAAGTNAGMNSARRLRQKGTLTEKDALAITRDAIIAGVFQVLRNRGTGRLNPRIKMDNIGIPIRDQYARQEVAAYMARDMADIQDKDEVANMVFQAWGKVDQLVTAEGKMDTSAIRAFMEGFKRKSILLSEKDQRYYLYRLLQETHKLGDVDQAAQKLGPILQGIPIADEYVDQFAHILYSMKNTPTIGAMDKAFKDKVIIDFPIRELKPEAIYDIEPTREYVESLTGRFDKILNTGVSSNYQKTLEEIRFGNKDIPFLRQLKAQLDEKGLPHGITDDRLSLLGKSYDDLKPSELKELVFLKQYVRHNAKTDEMLFTLQGKMTRQGFITQLENSMGRIGVKKVDLPESGLGEVKKPEGILQLAKQKGDNFISGNIRPWLLWRRLDLYADQGPAQVFFRDQIDRALDRYCRHYGDVTNKVKDLFSGLDFDMDSYLNDQINIPGVGNMTRQQMLAVYTGQYDVHKMGRILKGNLKGDDLKSAEEKVLKVIDQINEVDKQIYGAMRETYDYIKPQLNEISRVLRGRPLEEVDAYTPAQTGNHEASLKDVIESMFYLDDKGQIPLVRAVEKSRILERTPNAQEPINLNELDNFSKAIKQMLHTIHFGTLVRDINNVVKDPRFSRLVQEKIGPSTYQEILHYVKDLSNYRTGTYDMDPLANTLRWLRISGMAAQLGLSGKTVLKGAVSGFYPGAIKVPVHYLGEGYREIFNNWESVKQFIEDANPQLKYRFAQYTIGEMYQGDKGELHFIDEASAKELLAQVFKAKDLSSMRDGLIKLGMLPYNLIDKRTTYAIWWGAYKHGIEQLYDGDEGKAAEHAFRIVSETQPMGDKFHIPRIWRGWHGSATQSLSAEAYKTLVLFMNQTNQNFNTVAELMGKAKYGQTDMPSAFVDYTTLAVGSLLIGAISRGRIPTKKETTLDIMGPVTSGVPGVKEVAQMFQYPGLLPLPMPFQPLNEFSYFLQSKSISKKAKHTMRAFASSTGIPPGWYPAEKAFDGLWDIIMGRTQDPRRILWSEKILKGKK